MQKLRLTFLCLICSAAIGLWAQPVTGVWRGKVQKTGALVAAPYKLELKLIKKGDSLLGTSYYFAGPNNYYRYRVKGYFDQVDNAVHWWDDELIENKGGQSPLSLGLLKNQPLRSAADFNCPGGGVMRLDGTAESETGIDYEVHLYKTDNSQFVDEWNPVIEDYFFGMADPYIIDSVNAIASHKPMIPAAPVPGIISSKKPVPTGDIVKTPVPPPPATVETVKVSAPPPPVSAPEKPVFKPINPPGDVAVAKPVPPAPPKIAPPAETIIDKYNNRKKITSTTIPITGDSVQFQFYDNAEVDGDSISLFLNGKLLFEHIKLSAAPYSFNLSTSDLAANSELTMVAENLGSIPPNTSFMMVYVDGKRYSARLESTENSSAVIRLTR